MENKDIILFILVICVLYLLYKMNKVESFTNGTSSGASNTTSTAAPDVVNVLDAHILSEVDRRITQLNNESITDSIKNLGLIARKIQEEGDLTLPTNVNITGDLDVATNITKSGHNIITPIGTVIWFAGQNVPDETYMYCNGAELDKTEHIELFNIIGYIYSDSDSGDKFNIPDLRHRFIRSFDDTRTGDEIIPVGTTQEASRIWRAIDTYQTKGGVGDFSDGFHETDENNRTHANGDSVHSVPDGVNTSSNNNPGLNSVRPKNMTLLPCIKVKYV